MACDYGHSKLAEILVQKSAELNFTLDAKDNLGRTAFHLACEYGYSRLAKMIVQKSAELNFSLDVKDNLGRTIQLVMRG